MQSCFVHVLQLKKLCIHIDTHNGCTPNGLWTLHVVITRSPNKDVPIWDTFLIQQSQAWRSRTTAADLNKDIAHFPLSGKIWSAGQNHCGCRKANLIGERASPLCYYVLLIEPISLWGIKTGSVLIFTLKEVLGTEASRLQQFQRLALSVRSWLTWTMVAGLESHWQSAVV
jgi:hypothetical protein